MAAVTMIEDALRDRGLVPRDFLDDSTGRSWTIAQFPDGAWFAASPGRGPQWWRGSGPWRLEIGNTMRILQVIERGPPGDYDKLPTGLPEEWMAGLVERRPPETVSRRKQPKIRVQFDFTEGAVSNLDALVERLDGASRAEIVRRAIRLLDETTKGKCSYCGRDD